MRAKNIYGFGDFSDPTSVTPSDVPDFMDILTTAKVGTDVQITWTEPSDNGVAIDKYEILFLKSDGTTFVEDTVNCDGSTIPVNQLSCTIPMLDLKTLTGLSIGSLIRVKARAHNSNSWGAYS